jgi:hypothetical protein
MSKQARGTAGYAASHNLLELASGILQIEMQARKFYGGIPKMPGTAATANLQPGTSAPATGIYVVQHRNPAHAQPHEVLIPAGVILPVCNICSGAKFSLKAYAPQPFEENEFFRARIPAPQVNDQVLNRVA